MSKSKTSERDDDCQRVVSEYFELTAATLESQGELCRKASEKAAQGSYTADDAQRDWQDLMNSAADYSREATRLWFDGLNRCAFMTGSMMWPGLDSLFGGGQDPKK